MTVEHLLARINERHGAGFRLHGRYTLGENQGAYAVADAAGAPFVLKWDRRPERLPRLDRARRITDRLRGLGAPSPPTPWPAPAPTATPTGSRPPCLGRHQ